jgi:hypothetical protein
MANLYFGRAQQLDSGQMVGDIVGVLKTHYGEIEKDLP